ncbi:MAG: C69 family dipeptidase [Bacteroidales bacterium]
MKKSCLFLITFLCIFSLSAQVPDFGQNCSTIIIGKDASASGFVIIAHNEDDGGKQIVNFYKFPSRDHHQGEILKFREGAAEQQASHTNSYLWMEMPGQDFADSYLNEFGVLITSNSCPSREFYGEITDGGIGYELRKIIAERAVSARAGVELAGQLIDKWGYNSSGRTYTIADKNEAWMFAVIRGKLWVAERIPDNKVAFIPNYYTIKEIDLNDSKNFLASKELVAYAERRGWFKSDIDGPFNFSKVYSLERSLNNMSNIGRMWIGVEMLSGKDYKQDDNFPFTFLPLHKIAMKDLFPVLANHYEGTSLDDSQEYKKCTPHLNNTQNICASSQQLSFIAELRPEMPWDIGGRIWVAPRRGCVNAYMPVYFGVTEMPRSLTMDTPEKAYELHFKRTDTIYKRNNSMTWWNFVAVAEYTDEDFINRFPERLKIKEDLQQYYTALARQLEKDYLSIYKKEPSRAAEMINNFEKEILAKTISENNKYLGK